MRRYVNYEKPNAYDPAMFFKTSTPPTDELTSGLLSLGFTSKDAERLITISQDRGITRAQLRMMLDHAQGKTERFKTTLLAFAKSRRCDSTKVKPESGPGTF